MVARGRWRGEKAVDTLLDSAGEQIKILIELAG
jgi:hypothetical protein